MQNTNRSRRSFTQEVIFFYVSGPYFNRMGVLGASIVWDSRFG